MKRHMCTVAVGLALTLVGAGPALATGLPGLGDVQTATQSTTFGDQTVGEQRNDADVTQKQGNGNVNVAPAIALGSPKHDDCKSTCHGKKRGKHGPSHGGDASTWNSQGNGNQAYAYVDQSNRAYQLQAAKQKQSLVQACRG